MYRSEGRIFTVLGKYVEVKPDSKLIPRGYGVLVAIYRAKRKAGLDPERTLTKEALAYPSATYASPTTRDRRQAHVLTAALKEAVRRDIIRSV